MKKTITTTLLAILMCICVAFGFAGLGATTAFAADDLTVPIDTGASVTLKDSDSDGYYEINTANDLYAFAALVNSGSTGIKGELTADITVNPGTFDANGNYTAKAGETVRIWIPIGNDTYEYTGTFDGQRHTVSGLYFNDDTINNVGLFGYVRGGGKVQNVGVIDSYISGRYYVGGVVGRNYGTVKDCYNTGSVSGDQDVSGVVGYNYRTGTVANSYNTGSVSGNRYVGGVVGYNDTDGTVKNCYNTGSVSGANVGGVVGFNNADGTVENCYNTGSVSGNQFVGGVVGYNYGTGTVANCYNTGSVSGNSYVGGVVGYNTTNGTVENNYYLADSDDENGGKTSDQFASGEVAYKLRTEAAKNTGAEIWGQNLDGEGDKDAYPVLDATKTVYYGYFSCADDETVKYTNDSTASAEKPHSYDETGICTAVAGETHYQPAVLTTDKYDVNDDVKDEVYEISNAGQLYWFADKVNNDNTNYGSANAVLTADITVNPGTFDANGNYTAKAGETVRAWTTIGNYDIHYTGTFDGQGHTVSGIYINGSTAEYQGLFGIVGENGRVQNVTVADSYVKGWGPVGGVVGKNYGTVSNSYNTGSVRGSFYVGGVVGNNYGTVSNCYNTGSVSGKTEVGGVVGNNYGTVSNCYNTGSVSGNSEVGGVVGQNNSTLVSNCYYLADSDDGNDGKTAAQFASGEVAYLLQSGVAEVDGVTPEIWGQTLSGQTVDAYPVFANGTNSVYQIENTGCAVGYDAYIYSNDENAVYAPAHTEGTAATCTVSAVCSVCQNEYGEALGHDWKDADCTTPKTCEVCGETDGEALGHDMSEATCTAPATCKRNCGYTEGEALGHDWKDADCTTPKTCEVCSETDGEALGHDMSEATCTAPATCKRNCGHTEGEALGHDMSEATCTAPATCKRNCGFTEGEALGHDMSEATCTAPATCKRNCGHTDGEALGHDWKDADCTTPKTCEVCSETDGEALGHDMSEATCTAPATCKRNCGYINEDETKEHSFVERVCEYCGMVQLLKVKNGDTETFYSSWSEMVNYINENDNCEVTLVDDVTIDNNSSGINKNLTIDLAGHKLSNSAIKAGSSGSGIKIKIEITDSSADKTGELLGNGAYKCLAAYGGSTIVLNGIRTNGGFSVMSGGLVIINDMVATSSSTELQVLSGSYTVNGGTFNKLNIKFNDQETDGCSASVKNITCTEYVVTGYEGYTIADTLAEGYALTYANGDLVDATSRKASGEKISAVEHTHEYTHILADETSHWTGCACGAVTDDTTPEEHKGGEASCTARAICEVCRKEYGNFTDHDWKDVTCTTPKTCKVCEETEGGVLGHDWNDDGICEVCNEAPPAVNLDETNSISIHEAYVAHYVKFIPEETGMYVIFSDNGGNDDDIDPYVYVVEGLRDIADNDDDPALDTLNFYCVFEAEAGETYYIELYAYESNVEYCYTIEKYIDISHQPTSVEPYVELNWSLDATYQWCEAKRGAEITDENADGVVSWDTADTSSYDAEKGWTGVWVNIQDSDYLGYFTLSLKAGDTVTVEITGDSYYGLGLYDHSAEDGLWIEYSRNTTYELNIEWDGEYTFIIFGNSDDIYVKAYIGSYEYTMIDGETSAAFGNPALGKSYACIVTYSDNRTVISDILTCVPVITSQPTEDDPAVETNDEDATYQWYEAEIAQTAITDTTKGVSGFPPNMTGVYENGAWTPYHLGNGGDAFYFTIELMAGDTVNVSFVDRIPADFVIINIVNSETVYCDIQESATTFTALYDGLYLLTATFSSAEDLSPIIVTMPYFALADKLDGETSAALGNPALGKSYACIVTYSDNSTEISDILTYVPVITSQPTVDDPAVETNDEDATYQWYEVEKAQAEITDENADGVVSRDTADTSSYDAEKGWTGVWVNIRDSAYLGYFTLSLKAGDTVTVEITGDSYFGLGLYDHSAEDGPWSNYSVITTYELNIEWDGEYTFVIFGNSDDDIYVKAYIGSYEYTVIDGETSARLSAMEHGKSYVCEVTFVDGTNEISDLFTAGMEHNYGEWTPDGNGTHTRVCSYNGEHKETRDCSGGEATCTEKAICEICNNVYGEPLGHDWKDADCTTPKTCEVCGETNGDALGHDWKDADCTTPKTCEACGETDGDALGHDFTDADCTTPKTCKVCELTDGEALGHDMGEATCTAPATCKRNCGYTEGEALGHDWKDADCTTPKTCKTCGETEGNALGHNYGEWTVTKEATETEAGSQTKTCGNCDATVTEAIPALGGGTDDPDDPDDPAPTDDTDGLSGGAIAGIAVGSAAVAGAGGFSLFWFVIKKKKWSDLVNVFKKK